MNREFVNEQQFSTADLGANGKSLVISGLVTHTGIVSNRAVQGEILYLLGHELLPNRIATGSANQCWVIPSSLLPASCRFFTLYFDPVNATVIDQQGRRVGFDDGRVINEIPGATYRGGEEGFGWIPGDATGPLTLKLTGFGDPYFVQLRGAIASQSAGIAIGGTLMAGQDITFELPVIATGNGSSIVVGGESVRTEQSTTIGIPIFANDVSTAGAIQPERLAVTKHAAHGTAELSDDHRVLLYRPSPGFVGIDEVRYRISDANGGFSNEAIVAIEVTPSVSRPILVDDAITTSMDTSVFMDVLHNDVVASGSLDAGSVRVVRLPKHGRAVPETSSGRIIYVPDPSYIGTDELGYIVEDVNGRWSNSANVSITVAPTIDYRGDLNGDNTVDAADAGVLFGDWGSSGIGDLNLDGIVDAADAGIMFGSWGTLLAPVKGDLNTDGSVDAADAGIIFGNWGNSGVGDLNVDGIVDAADAGMLFENWTGDTVPMQPIGAPPGHAGPSSRSATRLWHRERCRVVDCAMAGSDCEELPWALGYETGEILALRRGHLG